jgi:hypothetical protein
MPLLQENLRAFPPIRECFPAEWPIQKLREPAVGRAVGLIMCELQTKGQATALLKWANCRLRRSLPKVIVEQRRGGFLPIIWNEQGRLRQRST